MLKSRKAKSANAQSTTSTKVAQRAPARPTEQKTSKWSFSSLVKNITNYFIGETTTKTAKKRTKRTHPPKKSTVTTTVTAAKK